ncbi:S66 peptidase family protein [Pseudobacter ginsenosidimutans]|uniref:Muramoyltetrapeptide carboxypeptidase n=1 Tax=Pseudobacter ginsenosidimutans TaxID=661488 RepID=A0A4Q7MPZ9_9BACT|nr:LD-carboxypeptidase [Pseudobacter ginsenosidimutans]QEC42373.1 LD-carboxypeptidase [Pseudobacter ginsenosidimutans]RZS70776.1 muramoyltetrapeptide carboxypeptidase [Pseudobacter ginsenosidimutans]
MNRKHFLRSLTLAGASLPVIPSIPALAAAEQAVSSEALPAIPPYLKPGDTIGITCPAGYITPDSIKPAIQQMESWGYKVRPGKTVGMRDFTFGGRDQDRFQDFQEMLDDPSLKAIMCARGGYGMVRIIDQLNFSGFVQQPKWIIGFSDITVMHCHLSANYPVASIHSKMCNSFPDDWSKADPLQQDTILSIRRALSGEKMEYKTPPSAFNRMGMAEGLLVGGNLKTIESLSGSASSINTKGRILFVEDTGEYLYSIDRMFWNLKRAGKLSDLAALVVGGFKVKPDDPGEEFGRTVIDIVMEKVKEFKYPVCFDFPVGHQKNNFALKCGVIHQLTVGTEGVELKEKR